MKNTKNIFLLVTSIFVVPITNAQTEPNFEFYNKNQSRNSVRITIRVGDRVSGAIVDAGGTYQTIIDSQQQVKLEVFTNQRWRYFVLNAPGKTKYLSWDTSKQPMPLYPQTGPLKGLMGRYNPFGQGKTESGLPLNNNIGERQITETK